MTVTLEYAAAHLAELAQLIEAGEIVEITRPDRPSMQLKELATPHVVQTSSKGRRVLGAGMKDVGPDFADRWAEMDGMFEHIFDEEKTPLQARVLGAGEGEMRDLSDEEWEAFENMFEHVFDDGVQGEGLQQPDRAA